MSADIVVERLFAAVTSGDRARARAITAEQLTAGQTPQDIITELFWPTFDLVDSLFRDDRLSQLSYNYATRLLRQMADQAAAQIVLAAPRGRTVFCACGPAEGEELGAQMAVDLLEAYGFQVRFAGGGCAHDELLGEVQQSRPDVVLLFCAAPADLPAIRGLIDTLREIGACPNTQIVVGGGVFNRAEGLAEEIGADLWAEHPLDLVDVMLTEPDRRATEDQRTVGRTRRVRRAA